VLAPCRRAVLCHGVGGAAAQGVVRVLISVSLLYRAFYCLGFL
jgi:hypothetical protein